MTGLEKIHTVNDLHEETMDKAEHAFVGRVYKPGHFLHKSLEEILTLFRQALGLERQAAGLVEVGIEPTRSILYRSAASLAFNCGDYQEARRLAQAGLDGNPPAWVADELREVLSEVEKNEVSR